MSRDRVRDVLLLVGCILFVVLMLLGVVRLLEAMAT